MCPPSLLPAAGLLPITAEAALQKLRAGEALRGCRVAGPLDLLSLHFYPAWAHQWGVQAVAVY